MHASTSNPRSFMALQDLQTESRLPSFGIDDATEYALVDQVLGLVRDVNGEVKGGAVRTLSTLVPHLSPPRIQTTIDRLVALTSDPDDGVRDIASLGLKMVVGEVQPGTALAQTCCLRLAPEVVKLLGDPSSSAELVLDSLDLLSDILSRFETTIRTLPVIQSSILKASTSLLSHGRAAVRKRTVSTLAVLIPSAASADVFDKLIAGTVLPALQGSDAEHLHTAVSLVGALARSAPSLIGPKAGELVPPVLKAAERDDDEAKEGVLQCLEGFVLRCPAETGGLLSAIVDKAVELLKYDPNFAGGGGDDEDEDMTGASDDDDAFGEDDEEEELEDEYDDEDDTSWKVRRSATKLLTTCISTRADLLANFYSTVSPALIARFGDREETVRVEVWATYTALLKQTMVVTRPHATQNSQNTNGGASPRGHLKRKRDEDEMDTEGEASPLAQLQAQTPTIAKSIVKQLTVARSIPTRQAGFVLLHELVAVLEGGGLETQIPALVQRVEAALKTSDSGLSGAATSFKIEVLSFLALFFRTHHVKTFSDELAKLVPLIANAIGDRFNKIAAEAFLTASELIKVLRPVSTNSQLAQLASAHVAQLTTIYEATMKKLTGSEADEDVKGKGMQTLGTLLYHSGDYAPGDHLAASLAFLRDRLRNEVQRVTAVAVVGQVAASPVLKPGSFEAVDTWAQECLPEVSALLRKVHRPLKIAAFNALDALLARGGGAVSGDTAQAIVNDLAPLLAADSGSAAGDINLVPHALLTLSNLLTASPSDETVGLVEEVALPRVLELIASPILSAAATSTATGHSNPVVDALTHFFPALVKAGSVAGELIAQLSEAGRGAAQTGAGAVVAKCIGAVIVEKPGEATKVVRENEKVVKSAKASPNALILALLTLGEVGRVVDLASHKGAFTKVVEHFSSQSEDVRRAAAYAAGNVAVGNPSVFLSTILDLIQSDDRKRYLALQALKEVIIHSSPESLSAISDQLWTPLFENCEAQEEGTRNVAADCLGQLTVINPAKYLPQLQTRLSSDSRHTRATVIAALRFTFTNDSTTYDELLAPLIVEFFKLMHDEDLGVRRLALSSLNSAAHNKPYLVRSHLDSLLPELYAQTVVDENLIRMVEMGPFKHKVDDGLDIRKTAYECMHSLLDTCLKEIDLQAYLSQVISGLSDEDEVKKLCYVMLMKLAHVAPIAVSQRLDETVPAFTETLGIVLKDNAVKQEAERTLELQKSAIRTLAVLNRISSSASTPKFSSFITNTVATGKTASEFRESTRQSQAVAMDLD
ncbi:cullin-associated NEDD8-dissociated protein 1 [Rhodotorula toruloides]|uniref:Cullin-associated NEDD8-dissociated protein 1 n=1 Tax=Rhodotorula toruloides TaxID=5286 RepID=A0A511KS90_RHOTO|nr:cullin-associated NEDD8-dissociated protein 1 [Rhodotorula toruloides]